MSTQAARLRMKARPRLDGLEERALLSSGLSISLTTNQAVYQPGQPIQFTFTETNNSDHEINTSYGPSVDGFLVSENGNSLWASNAGINPLFIVLDPLEPGQSLTLHSTWNGVPNLPGSPPILAGGTIAVTNQLDPAASATFQIASPLSYALSVDQSQYQVGQPIQIAYTETNSGSQPVSVNVNPASFTIANDGNSGPLWQSPKGVGTSTTETLAPGQSITQTATWNGLSNEAPRRVQTHGARLSSPAPMHPMGSRRPFR